RGHRIAACPGCRCPGGAFRGVGGGCPLRTRAASGSGSGWRTSSSAASAPRSFRVLLAGGLGGDLERAPDQAGPGADSPAPGVAVVADLGAGLVPVVLAADLDPLAGPDEVEVGAAVAAVSGHRWFS